MPELPEVETLRRQLRPHLEGRSLAAVTVSDPRLCAPVPTATLAARLRGRTVTSVERRGKYMLWSLDDGAWLALHLRMTGNLFLTTAPRAPYERARFAIDHDLAVAFCDPRRFGTARLFADSEELTAQLLDRLGPEPLSDTFDAMVLARAFARRRAPVKALLLDQRTVAGIGNIYADEALFRAGIHPARPAGGLRRRDLERLVAGIRDALHAGIEHGGASIDDFRHADGRRGNFQNEFLVHRRAGLPCPRCGTAVRKERIAGRGTYFCGRCQAASRSRKRPARSAASSSLKPPTDRPPTTT